MSTTSLPFRLVFISKISADRNFNADFAGLAVGSPRVAQLPPLHARRYVALRLVRAFPGQPLNSKHFLAVDLVWNSTLADAAQAWATKCKKEPSPSILASPEADLPRCTPRCLPGRWIGRYRIQRRGKSITGLFKMRVELTLDGTGRHRTRCHCIRRNSALGERGIPVQLHVRFPRLVSAHCETKLTTLAPF